MRINRIRLSGFKSFVEPTDLPIQPGLTGVVGPNGCGKSNLLEAIRWVMGENSPKSMRGGGMEDVIFSGTATRPTRDFAEVAITAERNAEEVAKSTIEADETELEIVRRIERGAGSAYRANGHDVRAKDVALIFADAATGAHSPALVSQGKIAGVISAKPTERRQMLEEAAGIAGLHVRRKDAEQKLRAAESNLARLADILADMDNRAAQLRRQARAAERYRKLSDEIKRSEAKLIYARWLEAKSAAETARHEADEAKEKVALAQAGAEEADRQREAALVALARDRAAHSKARDLHAERSRELLSLENRLQRIVDRLAEIDSQLAALDQEAARENERARAAADNSTALTAELAVLEQELETTESERPRLAEAVAASERLVRDNELQLARARAEQARIDADRRVANSRLEMAERRERMAAIALSKLEADQAALGDMAELERQFEAATRDVASAEEDQAQLAAGIEQLEAASAAARTARDEAQDRLAATRTRLAALDSEIATLEASLADHGEDDPALRHLSADPGYEKALAASLGDDIHAGMGDGPGPRWRAAVPGDPVELPIPKGGERLSDHVEAPPALLPRLRQIFVVDQDEGQALAPGQRLVTRDGHVRRWDGFVGGEEGALAAERLERANRLRKLADDRPSLQADFSRGEEDVEGHAAKLTEVGQLLSSARDSRTAVEKRLREARNRADDAEHGLERNRRDRDALAERAAAAREERDAAAAELAEAKAAIAQLPPGDETDSAVSRLTDEDETLRIGLATTQREQAGLESRLAAKRERRAAASAELAGLRARSGEATERLVAIGERRSALEEERESFAGQPERLEAELERFRANENEGADELARLVAAETASEAALNGAEREARESTERLALLREARAMAEARAENQDARRIEMGRISGERFECPPPLLPERGGFEPEDVAAAEVETPRLDKLKAERERIGPVNLIAADELSELEEERATSETESAELQQAINQLRGSIGTLNREGRQRLLTAFEQVDAHFQRLFDSLFQGGRAHLELIESDDPLEAGLEIMAQPPGKRLAGLSLLSGGEQALTAVALIFALFLTNPAPICVLDEVDAPLDDANIERFCDLLDRMVRETDTRYLIVTHNAVTMSRMHRLFGVTMIEKGVSRLVSVDLGGAEELLAAE